MANFDNDDQNQELCIFYRDLMYEIKERDKIIENLMKLVADALALNKTKNTNEFNINLATQNYVGTTLLARAKFKSDKRSSIFLLKLIKKKILNKKPIEGALADYLISAIDAIAENPNSFNAKKAFLLNGTMSKDGIINKVGVAVDNALKDGYKKHKAIDRDGNHGNSAYGKVAKDLKLSTSTTETYHRKYKNKIKIPEYEKILTDQNNLLDKITYDFIEKSNRNILELEMKKNATPDPDQNKIGLSSLLKK
ncbi:MAG: hypothetical protein HOO92_07720 [Methylococcaceae bacterium]|nr:hypothetical protein [Methylococcaceae bacterium]